MSVLTPIITQTVNDCINVSDRKIATRNRQNVTFKHEQLKHTQHDSMTTQFFCPDKYHTRIVY